MVFDDETKKNYKKSPLLTICCKCKAWTLPIHLILKKINIFSDTENIKFVDAAVRDTILNTLLSQHGLS